ncbi:MAG TPA: ATP-binding cassette domain-containing protein [Sphingomonas sp.]|jgi:simple sugar transport system ATP-binding protein
MLMKLTGIGKRYGAVTALSGIDFAVASGAVVCVLGDNGAGKSTLIKIISGIHSPDGGVFELDGKPVSLGSPRDAIARGIATVHQDLAIAPLMPVWANFFLGKELRTGKGLFARMHIAAMRRIAREELAGMGIALNDVDRPISGLSGGQRQCVAIGRAIYFGARILILDEPTAALGVKQAGVVLRHIRAARERGVAVIFITHNPHHAYAVGDQFLLLQRGQSQGFFDRSQIAVDDLTRRMAGGAELEMLSHELTIRTPETEATGKDDR